MLDWITARLGPLCVKVGSGATPRGGKESYKETGISLIRSQNVYNNRFEKDGLAFIDQRQAESLSNVEVELRDVLLNITGDSVARACQVPDDVLPARVNQHVAIIRPDADRLDPGFLRYWLVSPQMQAHMLSLASAGATRKALTKGMIEGFEVPFPGINTQRRIAHILGTLDDKIELNHRMNRTLEAIARAIFKSWFIDFDPVHAKAEGREPVGMDPDTAALFPDSFQDSPFGKIPKGWEVGCLKEHIEFALGGDWGKEIPDDVYTEPAYCIRGTNLPQLQAGELPELRLRYLKPSSLKKRSLRPFDIVFEVSGGSPTQSTGRSLLVHEMIVAAYDLPVVCTNFCRLVRFSSTAFAVFTSLLFSYLYSVGEFFTHETGTTTIKNFAFKRFTESFEVAVPGHAIMDAFAKAIAPIQASRAVNGEGSIRLADSRDALLPKLLSGDILVLSQEGPT